MKSVQVRSFPSPYFTVFGLNTGKYGPENFVFGLFLSSEGGIEILKFPVIWNGNIGKKWANWLEMIHRELINKLKTKIINFFFW